MNPESHARAVCGAAALLLAVGCGSTSVAGDSTITAVTSPTTKPTATTTAPPPTAMPSTTVAAGPTFDAAQLLDDARLEGDALGAIAIIRAPGAEWSGASGDADDSGTPMDAGMRFRIGSITKPLVAALVLETVERDELDLDADVGTLVPDAGLRADQPVTVRMLLDHTSGIFNPGDEGDPMADIAALTDPALRAEAEDLVASYGAGENPIISERLFVALAETHDRYFPPGAGYHYSNVNYQLAAMVLDAVTGQTLDVLMRDRVFAALGAQRATLAPADLTTPVVHGYKDLGAGPVDVTDDLLAVGNGGSGGVISSASELLGAFQGLLRGDLLDTDLLDEMMTPTPESGPAEYGLGLATYHLTCGKFFGHQGGISGTSSIVLVDETGDRGVVLAMNIQSDPGPNLPRMADDLLCGLERASR